MLLTLAFAAIFCSLSFHASGGLQLKTLTHVEVVLIALGGILGALSLLASSASTTASISAVLVPASARAV